VAISNMRNLISDKKRKYLDPTEVLTDLGYVPGMSDDYERGIEEACELFVRTLREIELHYNDLTKYNSHPRIC
jgi:hypothetical protein